MVIRKYMVLLVVLLACIGCASSPSATPSPFEGRWVAKEYISPGKVSDVYSIFLLLFEGNRISIGDEVVGVGDVEGARGVLVARAKFTFTDTEIKFPWTDHEHIIKYTLNEEGLITEDDRHGKILWVKSE
jgi:hypothetical protein